MFIKRPLSKYYPFLKDPIRRIKILAKSFDYLLPTYKLSKLRNDDFRILFRIKSHKSLLRRKLGDSDPILQEQKVKNLAIGAKKFNNLIIKPNKTFSFWKELGEPNYKRGFVDGMIIDNGAVTIGVGGGLCQLANLFYWLFLHAPVEIKEHHHHMLDIFPDSGRILPFGSGAGVLYNYGDLQIKNISNKVLLLKVWLDDVFLHGQVFSLDEECNLRYKIIERDHAFYYSDKGELYRKNKIYRLTRQKIDGKILSQTLITENNSKVLYDLSKKKIQELNKFYQEKEQKSIQKLSQTN